MIIYAPELEPQFLDYGIQIPIHHQRSLAVVEGLRSKYGVKAEQFIRVVGPEKLKHFDRRDLCYAHDPSYVAALMDSDPTEVILKAYELVDEEGAYHRYDPASAKKDLIKLRDAMIAHASVSMLGASVAIEEGFCFFLGGGMHHAMSFGGRGFCLVNDIVITLKKLIADSHIRSGWVIDTDAHKGDGTAECLGGFTQRIKTLSIHMKDGWPLSEGDENSPWRVPSFVDIEVAAGEERSYHDRLLEGLMQMKARTNHLPDLAIVVAGQDPFELDALPSSSLLKLTKEQMLQRDLLVYEFFKKEEVPQLWLLAGGYGPAASEIPLQFLEHLIDRGLIPESREA